MREQLQEQWQNQGQEKRQEQRQEQDQEQEQEWQLVYQEYEEGVLSVWYMWCSIRKVKFDWVGSVQIEIYIQ